jgi:hypothetical protein
MSLRGGALGNIVANMYLRETRQKRKDGSVLTCACGGTNQFSTLPSIARAALAQPSAMGAGLVWEEGSADTTELELAFLRETRGPLASGLQGRAGIDDFAPRLRAALYGCG